MLVVADETEPLLYTTELAKRLRVAAGTVQRWRREGLIIPALVTPGGQARWIEAEVREQLRGQPGKPDS